MKKVSLFFGLLVASLLMLAGCNDNSEEKAQNVGKKLTIVTTIYPEYAWVKEILGNRMGAVDLKLLIKGGVDLHSFQPSAMDIATIGKSDLVVFVGGESDEWIKKVFEAAPNGKRVALNLMEILGEKVKQEEIVEGMEHHHEHGEEHDDDHHEDDHHEHAEEHEHHHHEEVEYDEHVWLSLNNAATLVGKIAEALAGIDAANAETYKANAAAYVAKIRELETQYRSASDSAARKVILFGDRFPFRYLVDDYGIKYYAAFVGCSAESEASFETVAFLANKMDSLALPAIFTIENSNGKIAKTVLEASKKSKNAQELTLNSMQSVTEQQIKDGADYLSIMRENLEVLKKALN